LQKSSEKPKKSSDASSLKICNMLFNVRLS